MSTTLYRIDKSKLVDWKYYLSWDDILSPLNNLISKVEEEIKLWNLEDINLLIPCRWGEVIWSLLKNKLWLSESQVYRIKFSNLKYETGEEKIIVSEGDKETYTKALEKVRSWEKFIFIDDLVDSWLTIDYIKSEFGNTLLTTVLYSKEGKNEEKVDICWWRLLDHWIVFPWEKIYE